jgi:hypothetical protein
MMGAQVRDATRTVRTKVGKLRDPRKPKPKVRLHWPR